MFKSRQASATVPPVSPPSIEWVRKRAKHRLIGVSVLVLAGVLLFPMLFDTQPRPIPVDIPIDIPSRQSAPPLKIEAATTPGAVVDSTTAGDEVIIPKAAPVAEPKPVALAAAAPKPADKPTEKPAEKPSQVATASQTPAAATPSAPPAPPPTPPAPVKAATPPVSAAAADAARAKALLEGKPVAKAAAVDTEGRFIVQVGAFAETGRAQQVRQQLERAGLKTYTHVADTAEGKRIRVRLGPFATRAEAEKAAGKAKAAGLPAAILTL